MKLLYNQASGFIYNDSSADPVNVTGNPAFPAFIAVCKEHGKEGNDLLAQVFRKQIGVACIGSWLEGDSRGRRGLKGIPNPPPHSDNLQSIYCQYCLLQMASWMDRLWMAESGVSSSMEGLAFATHWKEEKKDYFSSTYHLMPGIEVGKSCLQSLCLATELTFCSC